MMLYLNKMPFFLLNEIFPESFNCLMKLYIAGGEIYKTILKLCFYEGYFSFSLSFSLTRCHSKTQPFMDTAFIIHLLEI